MTLPTNTYTVTFSDAHSHTLAYSAVPAAGGNTMPGKMDALRNVLLEADHWAISENCPRLIENLPTLTRDPANVEDVLKCDGDDPADAARYGLVSGARLAGMSDYKTVIPSLATQAGEARNPSSIGPGARHFVHGMPLGEQIQRQVSATDPTSRAIHFQRLENEAKKFFHPKPLPRRHW